MQTGQITYSGAGVTDPVVTLNGTGITGKLSVDKTVLNFGNQQTFTASDPQVITVTNVSTEPVTIDDVVLFDNNAVNPNYEIVLDTCSPATLLPQQTCQISVRFLPISQGALPAIVSIVHNGNGGQGTNFQLDVALNGNGITPVLNIVPSQYDFGAQQINTLSAPKTVTITNSTNGPLQIQGATLIGAGTQFFIINDHCSGTPGVTLAPGASCTFDVTFLPNALGQQTDTVSVALQFAEDGGPFLIQLKGTGTTAVLGTSTNSLQFGNQVINTTSTPQVVTLTNLGSGPITLGPLSIGGADAANYEVISDLCSNAVLPTNGSTCTFSVRFRPTTPGSKGNAYVIIPAAGVNGAPINIALNGTGITASFNVSPTKLTFGPQALNTLSGPQTVTFNNTSGGPITIGAVGATGDFLVVGNFCSGATLPNGGSCTIDVVFAPATTPLGPKTGQLIIPISVGPGEVRVALEGTAIAPPQASVTISPNFHDFGNVQLFSVTAPYTFRLTNNGTLPVTVNNVILGPLSLNPLDFFPIFANNCNGAILNPGQFCEVAVKFRPLGPGLGVRTAHLQFNTDAPGSPHLAYLTGTAISPIVGVSASQLDFGNQQVGTSSGPKTLTLTNSTNGPLSISGVAVSGQFDVVNDQCNGKTIAAGTTCTLAVIFKPTTPGAQVGDVTITAGGVAFRVDLYGVGITPTGTISPLQLNFGAQQVGTTSLPQTVTITNGSGGPLTLPTFTSAPADFIIQTDSCSGLTIPANGTCTFSVVFRPTAAGDRSGQITGAVGPNNYVITLNGTGVTSAVLFAPQAINFGNQQVGVQSNPQTLTLVNTSGGPVSITSVTKAGADPGEFVLTNDHCTAAVLAQGGNCTVDVSFKPTGQGPKAAVVRFVDSAAGSPHDLPVLGNGIFPVPVFQASAVDFGNQVINTASVAQTVKVTNNGPGNMLINSVTITGANAGDFQIFFNNGCAGSLAPGASCEVQVKFTPTALGARTAFLTFNTNAAGSPNNVLLTGNGVPVPSYTVTVNTVGAGCTVGIAPAGPYQASDVVTLTAGYNAATSVFIGWTLDGNFVGFANPLNFTVGASSHNVLATCVAKPSFADVNGATPYNDAITQMAARGFIKGFGNGNYGPNDGIVRAQMAAITVRLAGWSSLTKQNIFTDRCNASGCIDDELWNAVAVTAFFQVARGYEDNTYRPFDPVANIQAVAFITRTMVKLGYWQFQPDNPAIYPNVLTGTGHRVDISTYYFYAGAVPGTNAANAWPQWDQNATRGYFAGIYWQAYASYFGVDRVP